MDFFNGLKRREKEDARVRIRQWLHQSGDVPGRGAGRGRGVGDTGGRRGLRPLPGGPRPRRAAGSDGPKGIRPRGNRGHPGKHRPDQRLDAGGDPGGRGPDEGEGGHRRHRGADLQRNNCRVPPPRHRDGGGASRRARHARRRPRGDPPAPARPGDAAAVHLHSRHLPEPDRLGDAARPPPRAPRGGAAFRLRRRRGQLLRRRPLRGGEGAGPVRPRRRAQPGLHLLAVEDLRPRRPPRLLHRAAPAARAHSRPPLRRGQQPAGRRGRSRVFPRPAVGALRAHQRRPEGEAGRPVRGAGARRRRHLHVVASGRGAVRLGDASRWDRPEKAERPRPPNGGCGTPQGPASTCATSKCPTSVSPSATPPWRTSATASRCCASAFARRPAARKWFRRRRRRRPCRLVQALCEPGASASRFCQ